MVTLHIKVDKMQSNCLYKFTTPLFINMKQLFALHTCRLWSPEAADCKDSEEVLKCGLGGAEDPPLE